MLPIFLVALYMYEYFKHFKYMYKLLAVLQRACTSSQKSRELVWNIFSSQYKWINILQKNYVYEQFKY